MTARRMRLGPFVSWTIVLATACSSRVVRIVAGTNDSVVVNNRLSVPLPVFGVDARGRRHTITGLRYQHIGGDSISLTPDGRVTCSRRADAQVSVSHERLTKTFFLLCRPILAVSVKRIWVLADGGSADLDPTAIGIDGGTKRSLPASQWFRILRSHTSITERCSADVLERRTSSLMRATVATGQESKSTSVSPRRLASHPFKSSSAGRWSSRQANFRRGESRRDPTTSGPMTTPSVDSRSARRTSTAPPEHERTSIHVLSSRMEPLSRATCDETDLFAAPCS